jgi:hypothetical protein
MDVIKVADLKPRDVLYRVQYRNGLPFVERATVQAHGAADVVRLATDRGETWYASATNLELGGYATTQDAAVARAADATRQRLIHLEALLAAEVASPQSSWNQTQTAPSEDIAASLAYVRGLRSHE